jgi:hypothetical protein
MHVKRIVDHNGHVYVESEKEKEVTLHNKIAH